jgi:hypothetical protein
VAWARPDGNQAVREMYGLRLLGLRAMAACSYTFPNGAPVWLVDTLLMPYNFAFERYLKPDATVTRMQEDFLALKARIAGSDVPLVAFCHPTMLATNTFYDMHNVTTRGVIPPKREWRPPPVVGEAEMRRRLSRFQDLVEFVQSQPDVEVVTVSDYLAAHEEGLRWLNSDELLTLARRVRSDFTYQQVGHGYVSVADIAGLFSRALVHWRVHGQLPEQVAVRRVLGPPEPAPALPGPGVVDLVGLARACDQVEAEIEAAYRLPSAMDAGPPGLAAVPPATYLAAMADAVLRLGTGESAGRIELTSLPAYPRCRDELLANVRVGAYVLPPDLDLGTIPTYTHQQSWTLRPAVKALE